MCFFFFKQKTAYEMRISDWSSDVCSSDLFQELTGLRIEAPDGSMVDDLPSIQRWLNRIMALPFALKNAIFDEFMGLVEERIDAAHQAGTLDLGLEYNEGEEFTFLSDTLLRTDPASGATTV